MPQMESFGLSVPAFTAVFGMGWGACYAILVKPLQLRVEGLEARMLTIEDIKDRRIKALEAAVLGKPLGDE